MSIPTDMAREWLAEVAAPTTDTDPYRRSILLGAGTSVVTSLLDENADLHAQLGQLLAEIEDVERQRDDARQGRP